MQLTIDDELEKVLKAINNAHYDYTYLGYIIDEWIAEYLIKHPSIGKMMKGKFIPNQALDQTAG